MLEHRNGHENCDDIFLSLDYGSGGAMLQAAYNLSVSRTIIVASESGGCFQSSARFYYSGSERSVASLNQKQQQGNYFREYGFERHDIYTSASHQTIKPVTPIPQSSRRFFLALYGTRLVWQTNPAIARQEFHLPKPPTYARKVPERFIHVGIDDEAPPGIPACRLSLVLGQSLRSRSVLLRASRLASPQAAQWGPVRPLSDLRVSVFAEWICDAICRGCVGCRTVQLPTRESLAVPFHDRHFASL